MVCFPVYGSGGVEPSHGALAVTVAALVLFQIFSHCTKEDQKTHKSDTQQRSRRDLFQRDEERHNIKPDEVAHGRPDAEGQAAAY